MRLKPKVARVLARNTVGIAGAWILHADGVAHVVEANMDGQFKLRNGNGTIREWLSRTTKHAGQDVLNGRSTNLSPFTKGCRE